MIPICKNTVIKSGEFVLTKLFLYGEQDVCAFTKIYLRYFIPAETEIVDQQQANIIFNCCVKRREIDINLHSMNQFSIFNRDIYLFQIIVNCLFRERSMELVSTFWTTNSIFTCSTGYDCTPLMSHVTLPPDFLV